MTRTDQFSDEDLSQYLDGEAPGDLRRQIDAALETDTRLRARLAELHHAGETLGDAFRSLLDDAPMMPDLPKEATGTKARPAWHLAGLGMVAGVVLAFGVTSIPGQRAAPDWRDIVANYQSLYVTETLTAVQTDPDAQQEALSRLSRKLGFGLGSLPQVDGLTFIRAQELGYQGRPLAQLTFLNGRDDPVALCIVETGQPTSDAIEHAMLHGLDAYSWTQDGFGILLVAPPGDSSLKASAREFQRAFSRNAT